MVDRVKLWAPLAALIGIVFVASGARAQVFQTDPQMTPLPQPVGESEFNLVTDSWAYNTMTRVNKDMAGNDVYNDEIYYGDVYPTFEDGDAITLQGLFKFRGEQIDPVGDARTTPGYFSPRCGFSGQLLLRGGDCQVGFGWYNIDDPNSSTPPDASEIYEFIPANTTEYLMCQGPLNNGFCPLAWDNVDPRDMSKVMWVPQAFDAGQIQDDPNYHGGYVGFAVIGNPNIGCSASKFSLLGQNQRNSNGDPWVTTLIYQSTVDPEGFYLAFEDLPMSTEDWKQTGVPGNMATNDGDFNDFVFYVSGLGCEGGGEACDTGLQGACSLGRTDCASEGQTGMCRPIIQPGAEICDNVDNDCDGFVDNGEGLCPDNQVCDEGVCVAPCGGGEFSCPADKVCNDDRICIDPDCADVQCDAGQACRGGVCVSACEGVTCPVRPGMPARALCRSLRGRRVPGGQGVRAGALSVRLRLPRLRRWAGVWSRRALQRSGVRRGDLRRGADLSAGSVRRSVRRCGLSGRRPVHQRQLHRPGGWGDRQLDQWLGRYLDCGRRRHASERGRERRDEWGRRFR